MTVATRVIRVIACLSLATPCAAQGLHAGAKAGASFTSLSNVFVLTNGGEDDSGLVTEPAVGGFVSFDLTPHVALQPEAFFAVKGASLPDDSDGRAVALRMLEVPVMVKLTAPPARNTALYLIGGPSIGFTLDAVTRPDDDDGGDEDIAYRVRDTDLGVTIGLGLETKRWLLEGRFSQGLRSVARDESEPSVKTRSVVVLAGVRF